jgi:hypothetical protein
VADFVAAMNNVAEKTGNANTELERHIGAFQNAGGKMATDLSQLAVQFDTHGRSLAEAVSLIDRSNRRTEGSLSERTESLNGLIAALDSKANDLEHRLTRFSGLLDQSLEGASERAREVARMIADSTSEGARAISENFETVRQVADEQHKRTSDSMRHIFEQSTGDAHAMFDQAAERFAEVVDGIKRMTAEMQHELETTRGELRKGILELPQETADSAAQMRRVIVDQIEALAELNRIVARHGRTLDTVEPGGRRAEPIETVAPRREPVMAVSSPTRVEPPRGRTDIGGMGPPPTPPPPTRRAESPSLSPGNGNLATPGNNGRGAWLSDLLTRASQDGESPIRDPSVREPPSRESLREPPPETPRGERHTMDSLDSIAVDIARMIDHEAAGELWDRYKRGERNVFTRKLYTMQGQRAFDEIRRKYRSDREFMQTVDRYVAEFERLLDEVSRDDRGQVMARTYLTSETGKVYTMLAHAAGRFDQ